MTDVQKQALALLAEVWDLSPDVRLGQLMAHLGFLGEAHIQRGLGYIEDDELVEVTPNFIRMRRRILSENERRKAERRAGAC